MDHPEALCARCGVQFPVSRAVDEWISQGEGVRVLCPVCRDLEDELAGEALERQRQPENQPIAELFAEMERRCSEASPSDSVFGGGPPDSYGRG